MEQLSAISLEELIKRKSMLRGSLLALIILCVIILMINLYIFICKSKPISIGAVIPLFVLPMTWMPMFSALKSVKEEIKSRRSSDYSAI